MIPHFALLPLALGEQDRVFYQKQWFSLVESPRMLHSYNHSAEDWLLERKATVSTSKMPLTTLLLWLESPPALPIIKKAG